MHAKELIYNKMSKTIIIVTHDKMIADNCTRVINILAIRV